MEVNARRAAGVATDEPVAALISGGLDSAVLLAALAAEGPVVPVYVSCGLAWEPAERDAVQRLLEVVPRERVQPLVEFSMPLEDLYGDHWSVSGMGVPSAETPDSAVGLLGRNGVLSLKPLLWCGREGIGCLAIATLAGNPFADASEAFFSHLSDLISTATASSVRLVAPFRAVSKRQLVRSAAADVLEVSMSCMAPFRQTNRWHHCGSCNKCGERQRSFSEAGVPDPTSYWKPVID